jgi:GMP synthase-like glutamine amidotransferase
LVGHKEAVQALPRGSVHLLSSDPCPMQMIRYGRNVYATQFHPESGPENFALRIAVYRHKGYFPPEQADALTEAVAGAEITVPQEILRRFVARYAETPACCTGAAPGGVPQRYLPGPAGQHRNRRGIFRPLKASESASCT